MARQRLRYRLAIDHVHDVERIVVGLEDEPSRDPAHIFDFADGLRIVAYRQVSACGVAGLSISASWPGEPLHKAVTSGRISRFDFAEIAIEAFRQLSHDRRKAVFAGFLGIPGFPMWKIDEPESIP
jgi:hypothetical protein